MKNSMLLLLPLMLLIVVALSVSAVAQVPDSAVSEPERNNPHAAGCSVLLVDDDWDFENDHPGSQGGLPYYTSALDVLGLHYDLWDVEEPDGPTPSFGDMEPYDVVVWYTGYAWLTVFTSTDESEVGAYLDNGGNFVLSSLDYYDDATGFEWMQEYLGIDPVSVDDVILTATVGITGNPIGNGLGPYTMARPDDWIAYWPTGDAEGPNNDKLEALPGVGEPFRYAVAATDTITNSTNFDGGVFKTTYLGWPFEWIDTVDERADILGAILLWMDCTPPFDLNPRHQSGSGLPSSDVIYSLSLSNNMGSEETFTLSYDGVWPISGPSEVGPIPDGETYDFLVTVAVPAGTNCYDLDHATITATAQSQPDLIDTATLETSVDPSGTGAVAGTVYDANTGLGIPDAYIQITLGEQLFETYADSNGVYGIEDIPACTYEGQFSAVNYYRQSGISVPIVEGGTLDLSVHLDASLPVLSTDQVSVELPLDGTETFVLTLFNEGTGDLLFDIAELPGGQSALAFEAVRLAVGVESDIPWLEVVPPSGNVAPASSLDIALNFDGTGLPWNECFTGALDFEFNDPYVGRATLPVELCITECDPVPPTAPILDEISNWDGDGDYLVSWSSVRCGDTYTLEEDDDPAFATPTVRFGGTASQFQITGQAAGTWYYRVRATNAGGDSSWSNSESVVVEEPPLNVPELSPISNIDGDGSYLVDWSDVTGATSYTLEEDDDPIFASPTTVYSGANSQYQITGQDGGTWFYRVRASGSAGSSPWSNVESVYVVIRTYLPLIGKDG
jgi:hypothetical protein